MSRIILTKWSNGNEQFVVGWDHPCNGAFWQEMDEEGDGIAKRSGGYLHSIPVSQLRSAVPVELRPLISDTVLTLLGKHADDPDSGYKQTEVDLT